ncbi:MAG: glycoside hydrolase family 30 protein, partial [Bacteroidales bacterium]|nr:glycoside hydrolase family 30 protein [Bacteroidales bacterium]
GDNNTVGKYFIEPDITHQVIDNFGASDAWNVQIIAQWPEEKQEQIAAWLFSTENDSEGNPKGIGLSLWRFYIGAGSKEQGDESKIENPLRRNECFLMPDGSYNWDKQAGQRNFMQKAKEQGVEQFLGFIYSAPVYWTINGLATNLGRKGTFNLKEDKYDDFARYVADVVEGLQTHEGIQFNYISLFNEPDGHWNWDGTGQEGTAATKYEVAKTIRLISKEFENRNLQTKILVPESSDLQCLYGLEPHIKSDRGYQIQSYFSIDSVESYIGGLYNVPHLVVGHSYWTNTPLNRLKSIRKELNDVLRVHKVKFWQSELCIMSNDKEIGGGHKKDLTMKTALYVARIIHHDMVYANSSAWHWWKAVTTGDYKDGLIYANPDNDPVDGSFTDSKLMWSLGNYSRFIRPGAYRINITAYDNSGNIIPEGETDPHSLMVSAYKNIDNSLVVVAINYSNKDEEINIETKSEKEISWQPYVTSDIRGYNLKKEASIKCNNKIKIPARSVVTLSEQD